MKYKIVSLASVDPDPKYLYWYDIYCNSKIGSIIDVRKKDIRTYKDGYMYDDNGKVQDPVERKFYYRIEPMEEKMTIQQAYSLMQEQSGFKIGDKVKILRIAKDDEMGWSNSWDSMMNSMIGKEYIITESSTTEGFKLGSWWFPFFVLEKIVNRIEFNSKDILGRINPCVIVDNTLKFGCTTLSKDAVDDIIERWTLR